MGRMYAIVFEKVAVSAMQDLFEVVSAADSVTIVHSIIVTQSSDAGNAQAEQLPILIHRGSTSGSGGATPTPSPLALGDAAFGGTAETNNTSQSTEGVHIHAESFNVQAGFHFIPTPETRPVISPSARLIVELQDNPDDALTMDGVMIVEEIGG